VGVIPLPMMILALAAVMSRHDRALKKDTANLGATALLSWRMATFPLFMPALRPRTVFALIDGFDDPPVTILTRGFRDRSQPVARSNA
jgi:ABC-type spermidine/putrescine transport system permease subunit II